MGVLPPHRIPTCQLPLSERRLSSSIFAPIFIALPLGGDLWFTDSGCVYAIRHAEGQAANDQNFATLRDQEFGEDQRYWPGNFPVA